MLKTIENKTPALKTLCPYCCGRVPEQCQFHQYAPGDVVVVTTPHRASGAQYADGHEGTYTVVRQAGSDVALARGAHAPGTLDHDEYDLWMSTRRCRLVAKTA